MTFSLSKSYRLLFITPDYHRDRLCESRSLAGTRTENGSSLLLTCPLMGDPFMLKKARNQSAARVVYLLSDICGGDDVGGKRTRTDRSENTEPDCGKYGDKTVFHD